MVHIEKPDLMACQLCDGVAELHGGTFESFVYCSLCAAQGPQTEFNPFDDEQNDESIAEQQRVAVQLWNQMQGWIAKGKLVDGLPQAPPGRGGGSL